MGTSRFEVSPAYSAVYPPGALTSNAQNAPLRATEFTGQRGVISSQQIESARILAAPIEADLSTNSTRGQVYDFERWNPEHIIVNCYYGIEFLRSPDWSSALVSAINDWQIETWLRDDPRIRASIVVQPTYPELAAREISRVGGESRFVQIVLPVRSEKPYGNRFYDPIYAAAVRHNLPIGLHFGGVTGNPPTSVGWPTYYFEEYVGMSTAFQAQLTSLILEGVFERFPDLRIVLLEGGWTWIPSFMWRLDKDWKGLRRETPWVKNLPSEYIRKHMRATLQPMDMPEDPQYLVEMMEELAADQFLLFSTDHPHRHATEPEAFLDLLSLAQRDAILSSNARAFYDFDT
jgi:predicted TIM-barrel fold metal-dependent hydrolase